MSQNSCTILIIDASCEDRATYRHYLQKDNKYTYSILEAETIEAGMELYRQQSLDVIVLDFVLPDTSGLEMLRRLHSITANHNLPIIISTNNGNEEIAVAAMKAGAVDYLVKHKITPESFCIAVSNACENNRLQQKLEISLHQFELQIQTEIRERKNIEEELRQAKTALEQFKRADQMAIAIQESQTYQQLRQSEIEFRSLSESSPIGIFRANAIGKCTYTNPRYQTICDCTFEEALGDAWINLVHPEDKAFVIAEWSKAVLETHKCSAEFRFVRKDGSIRYCRVQAAPIFANIGELTGFVGTVEDITETQAIAQMKNEFISVVSHELRTPLTSLRASLGLLASGIYDQKPNKGRRMLQVAADSAARLVRLVSDILDLERLESGQVVLTLQSCDAATLMLQSVEAMRNSAQENQITISVTPLQVSIWVSPDAIIQTLTNLLSNAVKFSEPGSTVWLNAQVEQGKIIFSVKDTGRGIPADKLDSIFGQFQQVDVSDSRQKGGTGLGLAICRSIIRQHGGEIWVQSTLGEGSTFYFTLSLAPEKQLAQ